MIVFNPTNIVKNLAINSPQLLFMIASLPEINCNTFSFEKWKNKIKLIVKEQPDYSHYIIDFYDEYNADKCTKIRYVRHRAYGMVSWGIFGTNEHFALDTKSMSELINTCKNKNIEELLNFI